MAQKVSLYFRLLKSRKNKNGEVPVYLQITTNRQKADLYPGVWCKMEDWDPETMRIKGKHTGNAVLNELSVTAERILKRLEIEERTITSAYLKELIQNKKTGKSTLLEYAEMYFHNYIVNSRELSAGTIKTYKNSYFQMLPNFLRSKKFERIPISECSVRLIEDYHHYMCNVAGIDTNTALSHHKKLKVLLKRAEIDEEIKLNPYTLYKMKRKPIHIEALQKDELQRLENSHLGGNDSLLYIKDLFLFSVYTGLRFSDVMALHISDLTYEPNGEVWIKIRQIKTNDPLRVPLLNKAIQIIAKYSQHQEITGFVFPKRSNQKTNTYLKVIAEMCNIKTKLTFHVSRHSNATIIHENTPVEDLMMFMGKRDLRGTLEYKKIRTEKLSGRIKALNDGVIFNSKNTK